MRESCLDIFGKDTDWTPINYFVDAEEETWFVIFESKIILKYLFKPSLKTDFWKTRPQFLSKLQFSSHDTAPFLENLPISGNWTGIVFQNLVWPEPDSKSINRFLDVFSRNQLELSGKTHNVSGIRYPSKLEKSLIGRVFQSLESRHRSGWCHGRIIL